MTGSRNAALAAVACLALACGGGADGSERGGAENSAERDARQGTLTLGEAAYTFTVATCDPEGRDPDGATLRGRGTAPDGRRLTVEVERRPPATPDGRLEHNVFVLFGSLADGEAWSAKRLRTPEGEWREGELGATAAPGSLVEVDGRRVAVRGTLRREGGEQELAADLRAVCPP